MTMVGTKNARAFAAIRRRLAALPARLRPVPTMVDLKTAAALTARQVAAIRRLIAAGVLPTLVVHGVRLIPVSELARLRLKKRRTRVH